MLRKSFEMAVNSGKPSLVILEIGPEDPELIPLKAVKALAEANAALYDNHAAKKFFKLTKAGCKLIISQRILLPGRNL